LSVLTPPDMATIELIGANDRQVHYSAEYIAEILSTRQVPLAVGSDFIGRPETRIYTNHRDVVKIRAELNLSRGKAEQWAAKVLKKEQQLGIHHPRKTWFIIDNPANDSVLVGSICPQLKPLNLELKAPPATASERSRYLNILVGMFEKYLLLAKTADVKLDEGLSNFAVDEGGRIYYLDDEYYGWDHFVAFSVMLGVFIRSYDWLDTAFMEELTAVLVRLIDGIFQDPHCRTIIGGQLQSLFMPSEQKERLLKKLLTGLARTPVNPAAYHAGKKSAVPARVNPHLHAVMADIHANDAALEVILDFYRQHHIVQGIVLGDLVGYGPEPQRCIEMLQDSPFDIIKGNHDHAVATNNLKLGISGNAKTVIEWTIERLPQEHRTWLDDLPAYLEHPHWLAVHGAPIDPAFFYAYVYPMTAEENLDHMQQKGIGLCLHGHTHTPGIYARDRFYRDRFIAGNSSDRIGLADYRHSLMCPGSVGQPRNGHPNSQCAIFDSEKREMVFISLPYDVAAVVDKIKRYGLPDNLGQRLLAGK